METGVKNEFINQLRRYQWCMDKASECREKFEDLLHKILWEYHHIGKYITSVSISGDNSVIVAYDYSCRGCSDCDSQSIPGWVISAEDPVAAAKQDIAQQNAVRQAQYLEEQKNELERLKDRVARMEKGLGH